MLDYLVLSFFFFNDTATTEIYTLSLHDALPISDRARLHDGLWRTPHDQLRPRRDLHDRRLRRLGRAHRAPQRAGGRPSPGLGGAAPAAPRHAGRGTARRLPRALRLPAALPARRYSARSPDQRRRGLDFPPERGHGDSGRPHEEIGRAHV